VVNDPPEVPVPSSPRGWLNFAASVTASYRRTHSVRLDYGGWTDRRVNDIRETAASIIKLLEKSSNGDGGAGLVFDFYTQDISWYAYSENERYIMNRTIRVFRKNLIAAGFLPDPKDGEEGDRGV
jgi:hypothetical protein